MYFGVAYTPFGETYAQGGTTDLTFTGQNQDTVGGLYDFMFREYSTQGRWPSPDAAGLAAVDFANPQSLNRYAYVLNNPLVLIDPLGLQNGDVTPPPELRCFLGASFYFGSFCDFFSRRFLVFVGNEPAMPWDTAKKEEETPPPPPPNPPPAASPAQSTQPCIPRNQLNVAERALLDALSWAAKFSGVTYSSGVFLSGTFAKYVGATVSGSRIYAADPQGGQAIMTSATLQGAVGTRSYSAGVQVGAATYRTVSGYGGPSTGAEFQVSARGFATGGGYYSNSSGVFTSAFVGFGVGGRASVGPQAVSITFQLQGVCAQ